MKYLKIWLIALLVFTAVPPAYAYWIWTPKTGKWVNPKLEAKPDPKEQFELAHEAFENKRYKEAIREFRKVLKHYPKSVEASESQYYLGRIHEAQERYFAAYQAYQKVIDTYPFSERIQEINQREFDIARAYISGKASGRLRATLDEDPAIVILNKVIENSTFGPLAPQAQYELGLVLKGKMRYYEAEEAFKQVLSNYPASDLVPAAEFQIAACRAALSRGASYDQGAASEAKERFEEFIQEHPSAELSEEARENIGRLNEREAESGFSVGRFYEKQKQFDAARIYYEEVIKTYPGSSWALQARERLRLMELAR
ncbi:MAG: outer membrane protein assembly factor BamD [Candidatus Omnitrophica bacterium]|nr:outer membrane protein assembly factor BamD [Candidatus Omnitrophota bacterium]